MYLPRVLVSLCIPAGYAIMHPSFRRPIRTNMQPMHTDIRHFESTPGFVSVRSMILNLEEGEQSLVVGVVNQTMPDGTLTSVEILVKYIWKKVGAWC